jgi:tRNA G37 N-methylase Trm5
MYPGAAAVTSSAVSWLEVVEEEEEEEVSSFWEVVDFNFVCSHNTVFSVRRRMFIQSSKAVGVILHISDRVQMHVKIISNDK